MSGRNSTGKRILRLLPLGVLSMMGCGVGLTTATTTAILSQVSLDPASEKTLEPWQSMVRVEHGQLVAFIRPRVWLADSDIVALEVIIDNDGDQAVTTDGSAMRLLAEDGTIVVPIPPDGIPEVDSLSAPSSSGLIGSLGVHGRRGGDPVRGRRIRVLGREQIAAGGRASGLVFFARPAEVSRARLRLTVVNEHGVVQRVASPAISL